MTDFIVSDARAEDLDLVRQLMLDPDARAIPRLTVHDLNDEARRLPGVYVPPRGALLLAREAGLDRVDCVVGVRPLPGPGDCEGRRLFVRPMEVETGAILMARIGPASIKRAIELGYRRMLMETNVNLPRTAQLLAGIGFVEVPPYYANPEPGTISLALDLSKHGG